MRRVTLIPGDGIGPEVTAAARAVIEASGAQLDFETAVIGQQAEQATGSPVPPSVFESIERTKLVLKGPTYTPFGGNYRIRIQRPGADGKMEERSYPSLAITLRKELGLYVNLRPIKNYPNVPSRYTGVDLVIFRENSEDLYVGNERMVDVDTAEGIKLITRGASARVARFAFDYMKKVGRRKITIGHKANVMKMTDGLWLKATQDVAKAYPDIENDARVIDALCMELVIKPETFDGLLLTNLYGDIVSDLCAGLVGGLGVAPGANIGDDCAMFEAVHGTAPDIAGKDLANPMAMILSAVLMLRYVGEGEAADRIDAALSAVLGEKRAITRDLGGSAGTKAFTEAIVQKLKKP
ncbi:MAG TPA: isocitrate/isopropylmalate dehydrogenase family protein [Burkholderiales bacterium]|nr:icd2 [Ramlibacter sp.]HEV7800753.1 isocitrate/isopropylmalate dehydrogenase family protein [Burkholderiales bacterium]